ncbi:MAG: fasciclin domain-containing protein [Bacteroidaceae bacterium]|nr:fasciclin domain-containing protein [Bacteroidaceae bacterium]
MNQILIKASLAIALVMTLGLVSCYDDDLPPESLYTYQNDMMSDYLKKNNRFSEFAKIVEKAGRMDLLSTYGTYTCFAPTNEAVAEFLRSRGLSSVDDLTAEDCDSITCTALIDQIYYLVDLDGRSSLRENNLMGSSVIVEAVKIPYSLTDNDIETDIITDSVVTYRLNRSGTIIYELSNDSVENGVVQPVDKVISWSNMTLPYVMKEDPSISIFNTCLALTGLDEEMQRIQDLSYDPRYWREEKKMEGLYFSGAQWDYCHVPDQRNFGYTAFAVPDSILAKVYDINNWQDLYKYACKVYSPGQTPEDFGSDEEALRQPTNPLRKLIAYHLLDRKGMYDKLYTNCTVFRRVINPTEWYSTMNPCSTVKVEYVYAANSKFHQTSEQVNVLYLNHMYDSDRPQLAMRGAIVSRTVNEGLTQLARNGIYYYIDRLIDYGQETQEKVFNARMRMDLYTLFPEFMNNDLRTELTAGRGNPEDPDADAKNYIFPVGYCDNVEVAEDGDFIYQGCRNYYWSYEGDELNLRSDNESYDITFQLPSVPTGQYQIRLGFCAMPRRGIAQFYIDNIAQGIPLDMRSPQTTEFEREKRGWQPLSSLSGEALEQCKKDMHNEGWYHGPLGVRYSTQGQNGLKNDNLLSTSNSAPFADGNGLLRKVIYEGPLDGNVKHTMRIRSVLAIGGAELMIDYLEIVPKSVYGIEGEGKGEDDL